MRTPIFSFAALVLATGLVAATQTIKVTPDTLASWTVVGTDKTALAAEKDLSLPANARLARNFAATEVAVVLTTRS